MAEVTLPTRNRANSVAARTKAIESAEENLAWLSPLATSLAGKKDDINKLDSFVKDLNDRNDRRTEKDENWMRDAKAVSKLWNDTSTKVKDVQERLDKALKDLNEHKSLSSIPPFPKGAMPKGFDTTDDTSTTFVIVHKGTTSSTATDIAITVGTTSTIIETLQTEIEELKKSLEETVRYIGSTVATLNAQLSTLPNFDPSPSSLA